MEGFSESMKTHCYMLILTSACEGGGVGGKDRDRDTGSKERDSTNGHIQVESIWIQVLSV